ncbi:MAG TPA: deoxyribonuclease [Fibrobacter sp.]|nr:deoxyribonuclease [Fibrobacter sp.]
MTRINVGVKPSELNGKMLIAEHREIKRIPNVVKSGRYSLAGQPKEFKLGAGHVKFFYDKLEFLRKRYESIYAECIGRGYQVTYFGDCFVDCPKELMNDYKPTKQDRELVLLRIAERMNNPKTE